MSNCEQEARNGTHESKDSTYSARKETAQECPNRVSGVGQPVESKEKVV
jgi:hypothetical protein